MTVNKVILIGNLGKDPETRYMTSGEVVSNVSLATTESWKNKNGERQERTEWHNLVFYRRLAEIAGEYLKKGAKVYIEGKIATRKWQDKETGQDRYTTEIIVSDMQMLGGKQEAAQTAQTAATAKPVQTAPMAGSASPAGKPFDDLEDDIPF